MTVFGIDLGTSQSAGCFVKGINQNRKPQIHFVENELERENAGKRDPWEKSFPSYVRYDDEGNVVSVGVEAKRTAYIYPKYTIYDAKRILGRQFDDIEVQKYKERLQKREHFKLFRGDDGQVRIQIGKKSLAPEEVSSDIIVEIMKNAFQQDSFVIDNLVISVPAYFDHNQKRATKKAAFLAIEKIKQKYPARIKIDIQNKRPEDEMDHLSIISEPTAAFQTYNAKGGGEISKNRHVLVFDLGAGTLDITIGKVESIKVSAKEILVLGVSKISGDTDMGGRDMDELIMNWAIGELEKQQIAVTKEIREELIQAVEVAKIKLSKTKEANIFLTRSENVQMIPLSRATLEDIVKPVVESCRKVLKNSLKGAQEKGVSKEEIDGVLVGGPTNMPVIRCMVEEELGSSVKEVPGWDPMLAVAEGTNHGYIPEPSGREYWIAAESFGKLVGKRIIDQDCLLPVQIKETMELPLLGDDERTQKIVFYLVEMEPKGCRSQKIDLAVVSKASNSKRTRSIRYPSRIADEELTHELCYKPVEVGGVMTREHLFKDPIIENVRWPDLPFSEFKDLQIVDGQEFEAIVSGLAREELIRKDREFDSLLEQNSGVIDQIVSQYRCTRKQAKRHMLGQIMNDSDFIDKMNKQKRETFNAVRDEAKEAIEEAEKAGVDSTLLAGWKDAHNKSGSVTSSEHQAVLETTLEAARKAQEQLRKKKT